MLVLLRSNECNNNNNDDDLMSVIIIIIIITIIITRTRRIRVMFIQGAHSP